MRPALYFVLLAAFGGQQAKPAVKPLVKPEVKRVVKRVVKPAADSQPTKTVRHSQRAVTKDDFARQAQPLPAAPYKVAPPRRRSSPDSLPPKPDV